MKWMLISGAVLVALGAIPAVLVITHMHSFIALVLLATAGMVALTIGAMSRGFRRYSSRIQTSMGEVTRAAEQALNGQKVIRIFGGQDREEARFDDINRRNFMFNLKLAATRAARRRTASMFLVLS